MDKKIVLVFGKNGSLSVIAESAAPPTATVALLSLLFALGLGLNAALAMSLGGSPRRTPLPTLLMHTALAHALDCLLNVPVSALLVARWTALAATRPVTAATLCRTNAVTYHGAAILQGGLLAALAVERAVTLCTHHASDAARRRSDLMLSWVVPGVAWLLTLALVVPIAAADAAVRYHRDRMACAATRCAGADVGYSVLIVVIGLAMPGLVTVASAAKVARRSTDADPCRQNALMASLIVGHVLLVTQGFLGAFTHAQLGATELTPVAASDLGALLAWTRYLSLVGTPLAALAVLKPARKRCEVALCCCRGNSVGDPEGTTSRNGLSVISSRNLSRISARKPGKSKTVERVADMRTPVLFATAEGLHLRVLDAVVGPEERRWVAETAAKGPAAKYRIEFCDVAVLTSARAVEMRTSQASPDVATLDGDDDGGDGRISPVKQVHFGQDVVSVRA